MDEAIVRAHSLGEKYKNWFIDKVKELSLPSWTSFERNLHWVNYSLHLSLEILDLIKHSKSEYDLNILDLGSGKGFVLFLLTYISPSCKIYCVDKISNPYLRKYLFEFFPQNVQYVEHKRVKLPFPDLYFDLDLRIEVIEYVKKPILIFQEVLKVTKKDGFLVFTPSRLKFLFKRDPHFRLPFLYLLPSKLQKFIIEKVLKYNQIEGYNEYNIFHLFWTIHGIKKFLHKTGCNIEVIHTSLIYFYLE